MKEFDVLKQGSCGYPKIKKKYLVVSLCILTVLAIIGVSFALYTTESDEVVIVNSKVGNFIIIKVLVDGVEQEAFPTKESGYAFESVTCENGSTGTWDNDSWELNLNGTGADKCTVSFVKSQLATDYITNLLAENTTTLNNDDPDGNVRYMGVSPNNYVSFNGETNWRIIGVFNVKNATTGVTEKRVKIIRESIGLYSWDSSSSSVNGGYGVNEWSQSDAMKLLNSGAYWNRTSGICYNDASNSTTSCNFSTIGLTDAAKVMISDTVVWNIGTTNRNWSTASNRTETASQMYAFERSTNTGKICSSGDYCNDTVTRTTTWNGKVGLMYPSDFAFATSGGTTGRTTCLNTALYSWTNYSECYNNSWLFNSSTYQWTMTAVPYSTYSYRVFGVYPAGNIYRNFAYDPFMIRPVVYLNVGVKITGGNGTSSNPYTLAI